MNPRFLIAKIFLLSLFLLPGISLTANAQKVAVSVPTADCNRTVLAEIRTMPTGGGYSASALAMARLRAATRWDGKNLVIFPEIAKPNFCSGATYLVFLKTINALRAEGRLNLDAATLRALTIKGQSDGKGVWGRWNANGPGTARLFYELRLGKNFNDFSKAKPGDFMKIFWTQEIGRYEHGHSVIFLGTEQRGGVEYVRFWSSNLHVGYSEKVVPRRRIARAVFSRLEHPENLSRIRSLNAVDPYLAGLLTHRSSVSEMEEKCGM